MFSGDCCKKKFEQSFCAQILGQGQRSVEHHVGLTTWHLTSCSLVTHYDWKWLEVESQIYRVENWKPIMMQPNVANIAHNEFKKMHFNIHAKTYFER